MQVQDWNDYQTFLAIAREGQIGRAAKQLSVDATTVSRRLRRLETRLGQTLFEQTRDGQILTEAGEELFSHVEAMARAAGNIVYSEVGVKGPAGTLRISVSEGFGSWFLAPRLPEFAELHPNITIDLVASNSYLNLSRREADVAVFLSRPQAGPLIAKKLAPYRLGLYAAKAYLNRYGEPRAGSELARHRLIGYVPDLLTAPELRYADEIHQAFKASLRSTSINSQFAMVLGGGGIGVLPCFIGGKAKSIVRILPEFMLERSFWLVTHQDTQQLAKVKVFNTWIQHVMSNNGSPELWGR